MSGIKLRPIVFKVPPPPVPTVRVRTSDGNAPRKVNYTSYETATLVPGTTDVYDVSKSGTSLSMLLYSSWNVIEVLEVNNTSSVTNMDYMFFDCKNLVSVPLFDTSSVTSMDDMFGNCELLTTVPLYDTSNVTDLGWMFSDCEALTAIPLFDTSKATCTQQMFLNCYNVASGALALYQQTSSQANPPSDHKWMFMNCGRDTTTGAAELAQIPSDWK